MRATVYLRRRNKTSISGRIVGTLEQLWVNDDQTQREWREVPLVNRGEPTKGDGPPPIPGDQQEEPSHE